MGNPIRIGVLLDSTTVPRWVAYLLRAFMKEPGVELSLVIINGAKSTIDRQERRRLFLYRAYAWLDQRLFRRATNDAFDSVDMTGELAYVTTRTVVPEQKGFSDRFSSQDIQAIRNARLDVIFRFGYRILRGDILTAATHGIWSYHHGDPDEFRGAPPGFWEVMTGHSMMGSMLQRLSEELDGGMALYRSWSHTDTLSVHRTKQAVYWKSVEFALRALRHLKRTGSVPVDEHARLVYDRPMYRAPRNTVMFVLMVRHLFRSVRYAWRQWFTRPFWSVFVGSSTGKLPSLHRMSELHAPRGSYWADPCTASADGKRFLFVEEFEYAKHKGRIAVLEQSGREWKRIGTALEESHHLSHPFIFRHDGNWYMIPESSQAGTVDLYTSTRFPLEWKFQRHLFTDVRAVDAVIHYHENRYWLFMNMASHPAASTWDELHVFSSNSPLGPWEPHPRNPIVSDVRRSRPAGRLFTHEGTLYRPAQDCARGYGAALRLQKIARLTMTEYQESDGDLIEPKWLPGLAGVHSIDVEGRAMVVDALRFRPFWRR